MAKKEFFTLTELAEEYGRDLTHIAKLVKDKNVVVTPTKQNGKACQALSLKEKAKLEKANPLLALPSIGKGEVELNDLAEKRGQDVAGLRKFLIANGFTLEKRLRPGGGRPVNVLSAKECARLDKEFPARVVVKA